VTDEYPPSADLEQDTEKPWHVGGEGPRAPAALNYRVALRLNDLILQLLSASPEWSVEDVAVAVSTQQRPRRRDRQVVRLSDQYDAVEKAELKREEAEELARANAPTERDPARVPYSPWRLRLIALAMGVMMIVSNWWLVSRYSGSPLTVAQGEEPIEVGKKGDDAVRVGEKAVPQPRTAAPAPLLPKSIRADMPDKPFNGQLRPPCPGSYVEVRGGCWVKLEERVPNCPERAYAWKGNCYVPLLSPEAPATSNPP
jgi:hypothetical protein